nr:MAG TPA: hypothetical protein [Caudoviricetes sp.]DAX37682.1 MAG TPA: hypothetical protein [Caudoviricetes sp.]
MGLFFTYCIKFVLHFVLHSSSFLCQNWQNNIFYELI